jgi:ferredoxin/flavodoxin
MKNVIYYFSGTGNSLAVAKKIQESLDETELIHITSTLLDNIKPIEADRLGFVFPVYAWGPPGLVEEFVGKLQVKKAGYVFAVATYGGAPINTLRRMEKLLRQRGIATDSAFSLKMPNNYIVGGKSPSEEQQRQVIAKAGAKLTDMTQKIVTREKTPIPGIFFPATLMTSLGHPLFLNFAKKLDKKFVATDACTGCGICQNICPSANITLNETKKPVWQHHCEQCMACIQWCPAQAIEHGTSTQNKTRYHHPEISRAELIRN